MGLVVLTAAVILALPALRARWSGGALGSLPSGLSPGSLNLIVVTLDTTRADRIGCYGSKTVETPRLDGLAARGVVFENAVSPMPLTLPAHCSLFTGEFPGAHGVRDNGGFKLAADHVTLAEVLQSRGWKTGGFVSAYVLDHRWGIAQGFDRYFDDFDLSKLKSVSMGDIQRRGDETVARSLEWIGQNAGSRFFAWVHLYDPHAPYDPPEPFASRYAGRPYDGEIAWTDSLVGQLLDGIDRLGLTGRTIVAVLADHGESLGEHGEFGHGFFIYEQVTRIPLVLATPYPGLTGRRVVDVVRSVDVAPTLLELLGLPGALRGQGRSLLPLLGVRTAPAPADSPSRTEGGPGQGQVAGARTAEQPGLPAAGDPDQQGSPAVPRPPSEPLAQPARPAGNPDSQEHLPATLSLDGYSECYYPRFHFDWSELRAIRTRKWHFIEAPRPELYDMDSDPDELNNVVGREPAVVAQLRESLASIERSATPSSGAPVPIEDDEETLRKLAALGYIGGAAPMSDRSWRDLPDPKERLPVYQLMNRAREEAQAEHTEATILLLQRILKDDPEVIDAYFMMGNAYFKKQEWTKAAQFYRQTLEKRPDHDYAMIGLADTLVATGRIDDAVVGYRRFLERDPDNAQISYRLAQVLLDDGRNDEARAQFRRTLAIESKAASAEVGLAVVAYRNKDLAGAVQSIERALAIDPKARHARYNLALVLEAQGDTSGAAEAYRREIADYPTAYKANFNLGRLLGRTGDSAGAVAALRQCVDLNPDFVVGRFFLAQTLLASGDVHAAMAEAQTALRSGADSEYAPLGHYVLADALGRLGRASEAEAEVRRGRALESRPHSRHPGEPATSD